MGWQKRSTHRNYDSRSGHAFLFGLNSSIVFSKERRKCSVHERLVEQNGNEKQVMKHKCARNYNNKSSKGMECDAAVAMAVSICNKFKGKVFIANFVSDDDASTRNLLTNDKKIHIYRTPSPPPHSSRISTTELNTLPNQSLV